MTVRSKYPFTGTLNSKSKADLQDVAHALGLSMDGQKKDILGQIKAYFDANTTLCNHPRYEGLFHQVRHRPVALQEGKASNLDAATPVPVSIPMSSNVVTMSIHHFISLHPSIDPSLQLPVTHVPHPMHAPTPPFYHHSAVLVDRHTGS